MTAPYDASLLSSLRTATNLSLTDLVDLNTVATSSPRFGASQDELVARQLWRDELTRMAGRLEDRQLARDLDRALRENRSVEAVRREREASEAGATARLNASLSRTSLNTAGGAAAGPSRSSGTFSSSSSSIATFATRQSSASTAATSTSSTDCVICGDGQHLGTNYLLPCRHRACSHCLRELFLLATKEEAHNPASCCSRALPEYLQTNAKLSTTERLEYKAACQEFACKNRLYCSSKTCSYFLGSADGAKTTVSCSKCGTRSCSSCKAPDHPTSQACAADSDSNAAVKLALQLRGTRCHRCNRVVVRRGGCPSVSCLCGTTLTVSADGG